MAQQRRINNTQQSWARNVYDIPYPGASNDPQPAPQPEEIAASVTPTVRHCTAPIPGRMHPDAPGLAQFRNAMTSNLAARKHKVQFGVLSPNHSVDDYIQEEPEYPEGPLGISAYRVSQGPPNNGLWNAEHYHYTVMLKCIKRLIYWKVRIPVTAPPGAKQPKMGEPTKYSSSRNHDTFMQWLNQFLNWLRSHYYCGDAADFSRLNFLGNYVEGIAADWYTGDVDNPNKMSMELMKFVDAICMMHRRFICTATANNAITQYDKVKYSLSEGVEGFYYKLDKMANHMIERPSDYSFRLRLFEGLPSWIYDTLLKRNILPEFCTLEDIHENMRQIEELSTRARGGFKAAAASSLRRGNQNSQPRPTVTLNSVGTGNSGQRTGCMRSTRPNTFQPQGDRYPQNQNNTRITPRSSNYANRTSNAPTVPQNNYGRPVGSQTNTSGPRPPCSDQVVRDNNSVECYRCHQKGHISSDPSCPQHPSKQSCTRLNAQRLVKDEEVVDEDGAEAATGDDHDAKEVNSWGRSQYDPDDNFEEVIEYQDQEEGPLPVEDKEELGEEVRMLSMQTLQMFAMQRIVNEEEVPDFVNPTPIQSTTSEPGILNGTDTSPDGTSDDRPQETNPQMTTGSLHSHLYDGDDDIVDPVYILWRSACIY